MKKHNRISRAVRALKSFAYDPSNPDHWSSADGFNWLRLKGDFNSSRVNALANSIVAACLAWGTRNFRQAHLTLLRETKPKVYEQVARHPALDLLKRPNRHYPAKTLWLGVYLSYQLDGNAYVIKVKNARGFGVPVELYYAPHWAMRPVYTPGSTEWVDYYEYTFEGRYVRFAPEDVIHFKNGVDPTNPRLGYAPLKAALLEVFTDEEAARFTAALLKNMGVPGIIISSDDPNTQIDEVEAKGFVEKFKRRFTGAKRGEPFVATGKIKVDTIGFTPEELNLDGVRKIPADRVCAVLGIPGAVVGLGSGTDASTYNNLRNYQRQAFEQHLVPVWDDLAEELTDQLLRDFDDDPELLFDFDTSEIAALREDEDAIHKRAKEALDAGGITLNEYRALIGQQPDPAGDYYLRISSKAPVSPQVAGEQAALGLFSAFFTTPEMLSDGPGGQTPQQLAQKALAAIALANMKRLPAGVTGGAGDVSRNAFKSLDDDIERTAAGAGGEFGGSLEAAFAALRDDAAAEALALGDLGDAVQAAETIGARVVERRVELFVDAFGEMHERIEREISAHVRRALSAETVTGEAASAAIAGHNGARVAAYTSDLKQQTVTAAREAILAAGEDESVEQIARRISQHVSGRQMYPGVFDKARKEALISGADDASADEAGELAAREHRARLVAETESRAALSYNALAAYEASGKVDSVLVVDGEGCGWRYHDDTDKANGTVRSLGEARRNLLSHPRCARRFLPVLKPGV